MSDAVIATRERHGPVDFDPFGDSFRQDPAPWIPGLLEHSPGFLDMEGVASAYVAKQAHVQVVMRDHRRFSSVRPKNMPGLQRIDFFNSQPVMNTSDPPQHNRLRRVVNGVFQPKRVAEMVESTRGLIGELLSDVAPGDTVEIVDRITRPLAAQFLLGHFLRIPDEDQAVMLNFVRTLRSLDDLQPGDPKPAAYVDAWNAGVEYSKKQIALANQGAANIIGLIASAHDEAALSDEEMMAMMVLLYTGGIGSIPSAAGTSLINIARHPEVAERIRQDPAAAGLVLEESLRMHPPVSLVVRFTTEDTEIAGATIRAGMPVYCMLVAASYDPEVWPEPTRFDIDRANLKSHLSFGYGIHTCIGSAITRAIVPMLTVEVARRFPNLRVDEESIEWEGRPRSRHLWAAKLSF
jgi:cytochrome P450